MTKPIDHTVIVRYNPHQSADTILSYEGSGNKQRLVLTFGPETSHVPKDSLIWHALRNEVTP